MNDNEEIVKLKNLSKSIGDIFEDFEKSSVYHLSFVHKDYFKELAKIGSVINQSHFINMPFNKITEKCRSSV